jgi:uroporphyrinogen decarboxylase
VRSPYWSPDSAVDIAPDFERLRTALYCGQPDRVPLLDLFHDLDVKEAFLGRPIRSAEDDIAFHMHAGYDYYTFGFQYQEIVEGYRQIGEPSSGVATPLYGCQRARRWVREHDGLIAKRADFERFPWPEPGRSPIMAMANVFHDVTAEQAVSDTLRVLPPTMKLIAQTDGIFERFTKMMGLETFCYLVQDDPALVQALFDLGGRLAVGLFEHMARLPAVGALWLADDLAYGSGPLFSPRLMRQALFPWYRQIAAIARDAQLPLLFHSDGNLLPILDDLVEIGFNALQPIEPNAMDIAYLKARYGGRLCLVGNMDLGSTLALGTPEQVRSAARNLIRAVGPGGGYCLGSSNTVTNYVPLDNFRAMVEAAFAYGHYPLGENGDSATRGEEGTPCQPT